MGRSCFELNQSDLTVNSVIRLTDQVVRSVVQVVLHVCDIAQPGCNVIALLYKYHHSTKLYQKISAVVLLLGTMVILILSYNLEFHCTFLYLSLEIKEVSASWVLQNHTTLSFLFVFGPAVRCAWRLSKNVT